MKSRHLDFDDFKRKSLKDPEVKAEYERQIAKAGSFAGFSDLYLTSGSLHHLLETLQVLGKGVGARGKHPFHRHSQIRLQQSLITFRISCRREEDNALILNALREWK